MPVVESVSKLKKGSLAPDFNLINTDEEFYNLYDLKGERAYLIIFMCNHCPYVKAKLSEMNRINSSFKDKGLVTIGINSNDSDEYPEDSFEEMKKAVANKIVEFPYIKDETQEVAKAYGA